MPLQETSGAASYDAFGGGVPFAPTYIEDVFSTWLRTGTGSSTTVTTGLNASVNKALVWTKSRSAATNHKLTDTVRGATKALSSNTISAEATDSQGLTAFSSTGYTIGTNTDYNNSGATYVDWQWLATPKFFDVVTYTGTGSVQTIAHSLGSVPGCIIIKRTDNTSNWGVYHTALGNGSAIYLNATSAAFANDPLYWNNTTPTSTNFTIGTWATTNTSGASYVAYIFAHNAGGFGLTGTDNVISCGSFVSDASGNATVNLGYEPQWMLYKKVTPGTGAWSVFDTMRGWSQTQDQTLNPNDSSAEANNAGLGYPTATGMQILSTATSNATYIYIAIRRGPMKVPTDGTKVFAPLALNNTTGTVNTIGFPVDMQMQTYRAGGLPLGTQVIDRLRGISTDASASGVKLITTSTNAETGSAIGTNFSNTGFSTGAGWNNSSVAYWNFRRAPGFFDVVCYTGTGVARAQPHNLGVVPELMIIQSRSAGGNWQVYSAALGIYDAMLLNLNAAKSNYPDGFWTSTPTTTNINLQDEYYGNNDYGKTYVAYLFASCPGVSKVGSYTGNGTTQTINCGFAGGARFVLIKRTDSTGDWYVWDTARGMTTLTDPYLRLNSTAAETATLGSVTTVTTGFALNAAILAAINTNAATYIFLAIA